MKTIAIAKATGALFIIIACSFSFQKAAGQEQFDSDIIKTSDGDLQIYFVGHGSLMFKFNNLAIHADPSSREADYAKMPKANLVLITHHHGDHFDVSAIKKVKTEDTKIILNGKSAENAPNLAGMQILKNGENTKFEGIKIEAVPAYNLVHMRSENTPYHPKGEGNGYVLTFGDKRVYVAGDTENTPEMKSLENIDVAFLPMNLPYTMTPEMVADAARGFRPKILYPYHYGNTDTSKIVELLETEEDIEVRIRKF